MGQDTGETTLNVNWPPLVMRFRLGFWFSTLNTHYFWELGPCLAYVCPCQGSMTVLWYLMFHNKGSDKATVTPKLIWFIAFRFKLGFWFSTSNKHFEGELRPCLAFVYPCQGITIVFWYPSTRIVEMTNWNPCASVPPYIKSSIHIFLWTFLHGTV